MNERGINIRSVLLSIFVAVISGIIVAWIIQEGERFKPHPEPSPATVVVTATSARPTDADTPDATPQPASTAEIPVSPTAAISPATTSVHAPTDTLPALPTRTPISAAETLDYQTVPIKQWAQSYGTNLGLEPGLHVLRSIPFETGWTVTTASSVFSYPETFQVPTEISKPVKAYFLIQTGWGWKKFANQELGSITLLFSDGERLDLPLVLGYNIRDWTRYEGTAGVDTVSSSTVQEAWRGTSPSGEAGGIDMLTITVPSEHRNSVITGIIVSDASSANLGGRSPQKLYHLRLCLL